MKKNLFIAASILLLAAGCGKTASQQPTAQTDNGNNVASASTKGQGSFKDLLAMGKALKCESSFTSQGNTSTGTTYIANGKMRGDFNTQAQGKTMQMHMIVKDQTSYNWIEAAGTMMGFKTALTTGSNNTGTAQSRTVDTSQQVSYNCQPWSPDDSQFSLPSGVTFQDQSQMMNQTQPKTGTTPQSQNPVVCAACNSATGSAKTQCLAALGCK